jgi:diguanylate cyclase (GGDEF)-like protein
VRLLLLGIATVVAVTIVRRAQRLLYLAARDRLTGVFNRGHFDNALQQVVEVTSRTGQPLALALLDIDHFKSINDQHGHARGDQAIRAVADLLLLSMRRTDIVARYGGEEFVVLMPGTTPEAALARIESLRATLVATPIALSDGRSIALNYSAGVAGTPGDRFFAESAGLGAAKAPDVLVGLADERLLAAKRAGRGRCFGPEVDPPAPPAPRRSSGAQRQR